MTDFPDPYDPFEVLRSAGRWAVLPTAVEVRRLGHRRQVRARVLTGVGAAVVLTSGAGVASAVGHSAPTRPELGTGTSTMPPPVRPVPTITVPAPGSATPVACPTDTPCPVPPSVALATVVPVPCPTDGRCPPPVMTAEPVPTVTVPTAPPSGGPVPPTARPTLLPPPVTTAVPQPTATLPPTVVPTAVLPQPPTAVPQTTEPPRPTSIPRPTAPPTVHPTTTSAPVKP